MFSLFNYHSVIVDLLEIFGLGGWKPRIGVVYHPQRIRKKTIIDYSKPNFNAFYGRGQNGVDHWTRIKSKKVDIHVKVVYGDKTFPCNFKVKEGKMCKIYVRKPHSKIVLLTLTLPTSVLAFRKEIHKVGRILDIAYSVKIKKISDDDLKRIMKTRN